MGKVKVVTFDLWDCLFVDDSDEPKRAQAGLPSKKVSRREILHKELSKFEAIERKIVDVAFDVVDSAFRKVWHDQLVTWTVAERLSVLLEGLNKNLPQDLFEEIVRSYEDMEVEFMPDPAPGVMDALKELAKKYKLAVISDAIFTPGRNLRKILKANGMYDFFEFFVFSDEIGFAKPHPAVFETVVKRFGIDFENLVHVGDRPHNDVIGPQSLGARAVLVTVVKERPLEGVIPDAICRDYDDLPRIISELDKG
ncbi:MAG: HAD family hydrolase [Candidatus Hydrogenedentes bacterium]|nr:HAD family hydrolase [Candidatus Hydrogenedentota bacterium]